MIRKKKKILAISGSTKKNSTNEQILKFIADLYKEQLEMEIYEGIDKLPHFNSDLDHEHLPAVVEEFRSKIDQSEGVLICSPEYVFSLPGSLKNAIEWNVSTTVFSNKPVAIIVAAASGEKAFESLSLIMTTIEARIDESSRLLIKGAKGKVGTDGAIKDLETFENIQALVASFIGSIEEKEPIPTKYQGI